LILLCTFKMKKHKIAYSRLCIYLLSYILNVSSPNSHHLNKYAPFLQCSNSYIIFDLKLISMSSFWSYSFRCTMLSYSNLPYFPIFCPLLSRKHTFSIHYVKSKLDRIRPVLWELQLILNLLLSLMKFIVQIWALCENIKSCVFNSNCF